MTLILSGTDGLSDVDGSAATPAIRGTDTNTGIFFPAADTIAFSEGGVESGRFDSSGNLGIGTSSPVTRLDVSGIATVRNNSAAFNTTPNTNYGLNFQASSSGVTYITSYSSGGSTEIAFATNSGGGAAAERARIDSSGNLLVGTTTQLNSYNIPGSIHSLTTDAKQLNLRNSNATAGRVWTLGQTNASEFIVYANASTGVYLSWNGTSWTSSSDERLKTDLKPIDNATSKIMSLRAVTGRFKTDDEKVSRAFLIAQDVQAVFPEAVNVREDEDNTLGLQYTDTIPLLVAAIKEQQTLIQSLTARIEALEGK